MWTVLGLSHKADGRIAVSLSSPGSIQAALLTVVKTALLVHLQHSLSMPEKVAALCIFSTLVEVPCIMLFLMSQTEKHNGFWIAQHLIWKLNGTRFVVGKECEGGFKTYNLSTWCQSAAVEERFCCLELSSMAVLGDLPPLEIAQVRRLYIALKTKVETQISERIAAARCMLDTELNRVLSASFNV